MHYNVKNGKVSPRAFKNKATTRRMSVDCAKLSSIEDILKDHTGFGVASITAGLCWLLDQEIERTNTQDNPAHCDIVGDKPTEVMQSFRDGAQYLVYPYNT